MLTTIGMGLLGAIALISMIMMMGNVISKSPYGRVWALIGGFSALCCAVLLVLHVLMPSLDTQSATPSKKSTTAQASTSVDASKSLPATTQTSTAEADTASGQVQAQSHGSDGQDLSFLATVLNYLKEGKPVPPEFLALLPDGGLSIAEAEAKLPSTDATISKPLQSQLVSLARSEAHASYPTNSYVPSAPATHPSSGKGSSGGSHGSGAVYVPTCNAASCGLNYICGPTDAPNYVPCATTDPTPKPTPAPAPTPQPTPAPTPAPTPTPTPAPTPPPAGTLVDGGLLKAVLGHSQDDVKTYFQYNQPISLGNDQMTFLRGSATVSVSFTNGMATEVTLNVGRFTPSGQSTAYYVNYLEGLGGMSDATPTAGDGGNRTWSGVYAGASSINIQVDTASNMGTLTARL